MTYNEYLEYLAKAFENAPLRRYYNGGIEAPYYICLVIDGCFEGSVMAPVQNLYKQYTGYTINEYHEYGKEVLFEVEKALVFLAGSEYDSFGVAQLQKFLKTEESSPNKLRAMWLRTLITNW